MLTQEAIAFAKIGKLAREYVSFAQPESVVDSEALDLIRQALELSISRRITDLVDCVRDSRGTFSGEFQQRINARLVKRFSFQFGNNIVQFKPLNEETGNFSEDEKVNFAKYSKAGRAGKSLACRICQCGGRCLRAGETCRLSPTEGQRELWTKANARLGTKPDTSLAKKRRELKAARGGKLAESTVKRNERKAQAKEAKDKFDQAQAKADLANKYYGNGKPITKTEDAKALGVKQGEILSYDRLKQLRGERDEAKAGLDKFETRRVETFKAGRPLSDTQINKPLSPEETARLGDLGKLPDTRAYVKHSQQYKFAMELKNGYADAIKQAPNLSVAEYRTIRSYTKGSYYKDANGVVHGYVLPNAAARGLMQNPNSQTARDGVTQARLIHSALGKLPDWKGEVRRDTRLPKSQFDEEYAVGKKVRFNGTTSTTSDLTGRATSAYGGSSRNDAPKESSKATKYDDVAKTLGVKTIPSTDAVQVEYRINVKSGKNISKLSAATAESEIALRHGWQGTVKNVETLPNGKVRVYLDED